VTTVSVFSRVICDPAGDEGGGRIVYDPDEIKLSCPK
jgi:hypothetical protein